MDPGERTKPLVNIEDIDSSRARRPVRRPAPQPSAMTPGWVSSLRASGPRSSAITLPPCRASAPIACTVTSWTRRCSSCSPASARSASARMSFRGARATSLPVPPADRRQW